tara:strand:- start:7248 stop:7925 length:678 start_codon:yes stop_codon:yes gene_type:complete
MAIQTINIGNIANDGTGDDIRLAFGKVNDNFELLDLRNPGSLTASNVGAVGEGIFAQKENTDLQFKKLVGGTGTTLTSTNNTITIDGSAISQLTIGTDNGSIIVTTSTTLSFNGGNGIASRQNGNQVIMDIEAGALSFDTNPTLGGNLDGNGNNVVGVDQLTANNINALIYDTDIRPINSFLTGFDFKGIAAQVNNMVDFILATTDVDHGTIASPASFTSDFGTI